MTSAKFSSERSRIELNFNHPLVEKEFKDRLTLKLVKSNSELEEDYSFKFIGTEMNPAKT
jgi:hypothetical protein